MWTSIGLLKTSVSEQRSSEGLHPPDKVEATQAQDVAASTFAEKGYNSIQFRPSNGGVANAALAIDNNGLVPGTEYAPYKTI